MNELVQDMIDKAVEYLKATGGAPSAWDVIKRQNKMLNDPQLEKYIMEEIQMRLYAATLGRKGGASRSEAKQAASRENGKRGGRPRINPE